MPYRHLDDVLFLQVMIANLYIRTHGITPKEFADMDSEMDILGFLRDGYEPFHLTGPQGVLQEVEDFIALAPRAQV